tara:strand:- start:716 stop:2080 length:1365 start_codon:yes stop_codon:yes gene_type:complete
MATFEVRVEGISGLSINGSSGPTQNELTEFLKDGVIEVTNRCIELKPDEITDFTRESSEITSQAGIDINGAKIISVVRETGTNNDWRAASRISPNSQSRVTDSTSLQFASKYNPVYMVGDDSKISIFPTPNSSNEAYKLYYVNNAPVDKSGASLLYSHSDIGYFSDDKVYLVILYAACQSLLNNLSNFSIAQTVPSLTLPSAPVPPSAPSFSTPSISDTTVGTMPDIDATTISNLGVPPTYTSPSVTLSTGSELTTITALANANTIDVADENAIQFDKWFATAAHLIEDEEDVELAQIHLQKIRGYIEAYSSQMQDNLNDFQKEQAEYQSKTQEALQQAQINAAKAQAQAQIDASKVTTQAQLDSADAQQEATLLLQKENQEYAAKLQQFSSDLGKYSGEVQARVQEHTSSINEISAEIQIDTTEYNWKSQRYAALKGQYDQAFGLMAPRESKD